ncbi:corticotropin-releasing factor-binding protein [Fopius arisanus]|uniref:Corticotropin-releasing factor-binding protein n=1 Tax=Fopius arisanus TaxID=64838 RepID=A0A0C9QEL5_9HYME|nr:PREDICTED: corticotropin-releasing factor-binding protein [Fopius arisanus]XP_011297122.1 PREDICTED: corticotropin-releasing factor-binding protein [Fopius arisanus]XP_011297123.1 PREDICTED: corticotropin-releasing factor-binding protein [Fopius arisanus]XP_011297124.1 PREDICTED: corticotropin-releasing factor-binding protein [Fopius arisanus]
MTSYLCLMVVVCTLGCANSKIIPPDQQTQFQQQMPYQFMKGADFDGYNIKEIASVFPQVIPISDCIFMTSETGRFTYQSMNDEATVCGVYFVTDPDKILELNFLSFDVPCEKDALVSVVDGWELNGELFPSPTDHPIPLNERFDEFCGDYASKTYVSTQNAALIQYRIPMKGKGFSVFVRSHRNPIPCNVLANSETDAFTLRNYGQQLNCTLTAIYPSVVRVIALDVGGRRTRPPIRQMETGTFHKCNRRGLPDHVEIGGNTGLDTSRMEVIDSICGVDSEPDASSRIIGCEVTSVRLVSSGLFDNSVTLMMKPAVDNEILAANIICGL